MSNWIENVPPPQPLPRRERGYPQGAAIMAPSPNGGGRGVGEHSLNSERIETKSGALIDD